MTILRVTVPEDVFLTLRERVADGRAGSADAVVVVALAALRKRDARFANLRRLLREGIERGEPRPLDAEAIIARGHQRWAEMNEGLHGACRD